MKSATFGTVIAGRSMAPSYLIYGPGGNITGPSTDPQGYQNFYSNYYRYTQPVSWAMPAAVGVGGGGGGMGPSNDGGGVQMYPVPGGNRGMWTVPPSSGLPADATPAQIAPYMPPYTAFRGGITGSPAPAAAPAAPSWGAAPTAAAWGAAPQAASYQSAAMPAAPAPKTAAAPAPLADQAQANPLARAIRNVSMQGAGTADTNVLRQRQAGGGTFGYGR